MNYISCESAAKKIGVSTRRIQQMCKQRNSWSNKGWAQLADS